MATGGRFDPRRFDVRSFAADAASLSGAWPLAGLARLASSAVDGSVATAPPVVWQVDGARRRLANAGAHPTLSIAAEATLSMQCQRCLQPVEVLLRAERLIFFVEGEDAAAALDADSEDDVLTLEPAIDLQALIEDELLLTLPLIPRHEVCPEPLLGAAGADGFTPVETGHPFAALAALKRGSGAA
jgi:uncharacterized protein